MKKKIITNTFLFIVIIAFVSTFSTIFGDSNLLVGVTTVVQILLLTKVNLTKSPLQSFFKLLALNLILGIGAYFADYNMWLGIVINFTILAGIGYGFSSELNKQLILIFALKYLFMLYEPVQGHDFVLRIGALVICTVLVMGVQLLVHSKNKNISHDEAVVTEEDEVDNNYKVINIFGKEMKIHTIRASYAFRTGLLVAISAFIAAYMGLAQGKWITYTVFSLTEFYSKNCKERSKYRLIGTIAGGLIVLVLFTVIKNVAGRTAILLIGGYLLQYFTEYKHSTIFVTLLAIASASLTGAPIGMVSQRITYVIVGMVIALIANKCIFNSDKIQLNMCEPSRVTMGGLDN